MFVVAQFQREGRDPFAIYQGDCPPEFDRTFHHAVGNVLEAIRHAISAVMALLTEPGLRLTACILLFTTAGAGCYPLTEEVLLPVAASWALCGAALCMLVGIIPTGRAGKEAVSHD